LPKDFVINLVKTCLKLEESYGAALIQLQLIATIILQHSLVEPFERSFRLQNYAFQESKV